MIVLNANWQIGGQNYYEQINDPRASQSGILLRLEKLALDY